ncbi:hypothetical protein GO730_09580 [Spirosoma sp. HMF3257]|uniref:Chromosome partitioning protein ParA n=2 Tax=Spirosoma telluris TaxID=2183553 RepID=A0A327NWZ8_9BACT|nr:hypothetical protein [Spirosoma telluris]RAI78404.1 hypothetical protein HMF3257_09485 [Spirosoma telluris]
MEAQVTNDKQGALNMLLGALIGILALLLYLFLGSRNETLEVQKLLTSKVEQFASTQLKLDSISTVLDAKIAEVRKLGGSVTELERIRRQLANDKKKLKYDLAFSIQKYNLKIRDYKNFLALHEADIHKLKTENGSLLSRTRALEEEKQTILSENEGLKHEKAALAETVIDYSRQNADLANKVTLASAMKAVNVEVIALATNGKERRGTPLKASRIDRLKITFIMPSNPVALLNDKDIYLRLLDANGAVVSESGLGGVLMIEGREIGYSMRQTVPFENNDQRVDLFFRRDGVYKPGTYTVELYAEGLRIGGGRFDVK